MANTCENYFFVFSENEVQLEKFMNDAVDVEELEDLSLRKILPSPYAKDWIENIVPASCKPSTTEDYEYILKNHILPVFGEIEISKISKGLVKDFLLKQVKKGFAVSTVIHMKNVVSGILNKALDDEDIQINPAHQLPEFVFSNKSDYLIDVNNWRRRVFKKVVAKSGLRPIRIHDLRHSYATLRIAKGDNIADVSNQLGHHSTKFTMDIYYHWTPGGKKAEVDALDD